MNQVVEPIMQRKFSFKKTVLSHLDILAGLDRGCSLTKIIYVDKADSDRVVKDDDSSIIILTAALFSNTHFDDALVWLKEKAFFPEDKTFPFHLTGAGGVQHSEKIKKILERDVVFIDEFLAQSRGAFDMLRNVPLEEMTFPEIKTDCTEFFDIPLFTSVKTQFEELVGKRKEIKCAGDLLPCIFGFIGSGGGFTYIGTDGTFRMVSGLPAAGKTFIGLSRCILGTNNYNEITAMAARGDRRNIDSQIKDILNDDMEYGSLPRDLPIISMGKLAETNKSIKEYNKDDIAHSLVAMFIYNAMNAAVHICMSEKVSNVFFGGNLFQAEIFRKEFSTLRKMYSFDFMNVYFISNGHTGALGAMMHSPEDRDKYFQI